MEAAVEAIWAAFLEEVPFFKLTVLVEAAIARGFLVASLVTMETPFSVGSTPTNYRLQAKTGDQS